MSIKTFPFQTNFTGGELSPNLNARADLQKYQHGARVIENAIPIAQGGVIGRPGLQFVNRITFGETPTTGFPIRLHRFQFNVEQAYILAFIPGHIRIYANSGDLGVEVDTPYTEAELFELEFAQSADVLEITHRNHAIKQLRRLGHTTWELIDKPIENYPMQERTKEPALTLTLSADTGLAQTADVSAPYFLAGDIGKTLLGGTGEAVITGINSTTQAVIDIRRSFSADLSYAPGEWRIVGTGGNGNVFWKPANRYPKGVQSVWNVSVSAHRSEDVGDHLIYTHGITTIDIVDSTTQFRGKTLTAITERGKASLITIASPIWPNDGHPGCVTYFQGRLYVAASDGFPSTIWGSEVGFFNNFRSYRGIFIPNDADPLTANSPLAFTISETDYIHWIIGMKVIFIGSAGGILIMTGGSLRDPIKHDNIQVVNESGYGTAPRSPVIANSSLIYIQRGNRKIRNIIYDQDRDGFTPTDLTIFADHLGAAAEFNQIDFAHNFHKGFNIPIVWAVRKDGELCSLTYEPEQEVLAWARHLSGAQSELIDFGFTACPADSIPPQQSVNWNQCYDYSNGVTGGLSNTDGQFSVIPGPEVNALATVGNQSGFVFSYPHSSNVWQLIKIDGGEMSLATPIPLPAGDVFTHARQAAQAGCSGHSDVLCYLLVGTYDPLVGGDYAAQVFFDWKNKTVYPMRYTAAAALEKWSKRGNEFYRIKDSTGLVRWDMSAAPGTTPTAEINDLGVGTIRDVFRTDSKLWIICDDGDLIELDPVSLAVVATHVTGLTAADKIIGFYVGADSRFFILSNPETVECFVHLFQLPSETLTQLNSSFIHATGCPALNINGSAPTHRHIQFASGYFYITDGTATASGRLGPILCPDGESVYDGFDFLQA